MAWFRTPWRVFSLAERFSERLRPACMDAMAWSFLSCLTWMPLSAFQQAPRFSRSPISVKPSIACSYRLAAASGAPAPSGPAARVASPCASRPPIPALADLGEAFDRLLVQAGGRVEVAGAFVRGGQVGQRLRLAQLVAA